jgi:hypothetical protein
VNCRGAAFQPCDHIPSIVIYIGHELDLVIALFHIFLVYTQLIDPEVRVRDVLFPTSEVAQEVEEVFSHLDITVCSRFEVVVVVLHVDASRLGMLTAPNVGQRYVVCDFDL